MIIDAKKISLIRDGKYILKELDWQVKKGQHWAILGLNGSGKTSLLNMINGYLYPSLGQLTVLGKEFGQYDLRKLRKSIGWVSTSLQENLYARDSSLEIVLSGKFATIGLYDQTSQEDKEEALEILKNFSALELAERTYSTLSQGEKQKVLIARAIMARPQLLILDEPCTGLDIFAKEKLLSSIDELSRQDKAPTLIYVTHRTEEILPVFKKTLLLRRGKVHSSGSTVDLMTQENLSDFFETEVVCQKRNDRYSVDVPSLFSK